MGKSKAPGLPVRTGLLPPPTAPAARPEGPRARCPPAGSGPGPRTDGSPDRGLRLGTLPDLASRSSSVGVRNGLRPLLSHRPPDSAGGGPGGLAGRGRDGADGRSLDRSRICDRGSEPATRASSRWSGRRRDWRMSPCRPQFRESGAMGRVPVRGVPGVACRASDAFNPTRTRCPWA
jgi:hypothetical protein